MRTNLRLGASANLVFKGTLGPQVGGLIFNSPLNVAVFRMDHDQAFQQTTHIQYQFHQLAERRLWVGLTNWDSIFEAIRTGNRD